MKRIVGFILCSYVCSFAAVVVREELHSMQQPAAFTEEHKILDKSSDVQQVFVQKYVLKNGMVVLVRPVSTHNDVECQVWYNVGSRDEGKEERGYAHQIEHMIFKGTSVPRDCDYEQFLPEEILLNLSERDIDGTTHKLSGSCNAFTAYDVTGFTFNIPAQNYKLILPILASIMLFARFDTEHLNSETKTIIQELKMRLDNYGSSLCEKLISTVMAPHPYCDPIIGYKQDLWNATGERLRSFYRKHYVPNNAVLVVVGNVVPDEVYELAKRYFEQIPADPHYSKEQGYYTEDIACQSVTLFRDVQQPLAATMFVLPGKKSRNEVSLAMLSWLLGEGKSSRLYRSIIEEKHLAASIHTFVAELFDYSFLFVVYAPYRAEDCPVIESLIAKELQEIVQKGFSDDELQAALKNIQMHHYRLMESVSRQAYMIGEAFWATGDENYVFKELQRKSGDFKDSVEHLVRQYCRPTIMHKGYVLPLPADEKKQWRALQSKSDAVDTEILSARVRTSPVEEISYTRSVTPHPLKKFVFPKPTLLQLSNGVEVLTYNSSTLPTVSIVLELRAQSYYDPEDAQGIGNFVAEMLQEGTSKHDAKALAHAFESRGISCFVTAGNITLICLHDDVPYALSLLQEMLTDSIFDAQQIEKVRERLIVAIKHFWDDPSSIASQLVNECIYKGHPFSKQLQGTEESVRCITREALVAYYKKYVSPWGARLAIVGDLQGYDIAALLRPLQEAWKSSEPVDKMAFPPLSYAASASREVNYAIDRDQITLCFVRPSIRRLERELYDKYLLFDQIFGGGALGGLGSRLFQLREHSGIFYGIIGSTMQRASEEPGYLLVKTTVSGDRCKEAEAAIKNLLVTVADTITPDEVQEAKNAVLNKIPSQFESNDKIARAFLFLRRYELPFDFFDQRPADLANITADDIKKAVREVLRVDDLTTIRVGRV